MTPPRDLMAALQKSLRPPLELAVEREPLRSRLFYLARLELPYEAVGLITWGDGRWRVRRAHNASPSPLTSFRIAEDQLLRLLQRAEAAGEELMAGFHSHPSQGPEPSRLDLEVARQQPGPTLPIVIVGLYGGRDEPAISVTRP